ncbi:MAG: putative MFS transporter, AGZA family, xanthine/uracil permease [Elusimicrobia bacterium]|nr:MAG: putative MFS transporter, AGZA family, xanthine/uracil permease [Elusimicrobiota bacterium]
MTGPRPAWRVEAAAGLTTFFTMAYIVVVNPAILAAPGTGMSFNAVLTATVLLSASMTLLMGLYANLPFGVAPGMGINAFFAYSIVLGQKVPWQTALGIVFWAGVLFLLLSVTPLRAQVARAIPENLRTAAAAGIGIFLTFIGLKNMGFIVADPATFVRMGVLDGKSLAAFAGLGLMIALLRRKSPFAFLAGMGFVTAVSLAAGWAKAPESFVTPPDFSGLGALDLKGALAPALWPAVVSILFTDLFDSISTFVGVSKACGLTDAKGEPLRLKEGLVVDSLATLGAGLFGTSSGTAFIESAAGIEAGGRTGRTAVVTGLCFLPCLFLAPVAALVPVQATGPSSASSRTPSPPS